MFILHGLLLCKFSENDSFIYLFIYLVICLSLFTVQPQYNKVQGTGKWAVLYRLVKLIFNLAYSRCCFGGSDNHFGFVEFICAHSSLHNVFACTVADLQGFVCDFQYCFLYFSFSKSH